MGVRITDDRNVALFDSVTGYAFGPVFESRDDAEDFMAWFGDHPSSLRTTPNSTLEALVHAWHLERLGKFPTYDEADQ
jgi:hypothetical protein